MQCFVTYNCITTNMLFWCRVIVAFFCKQNVCLVQFAWDAQKIWRDIVSVVYRNGMILCMITACCCIECLSLHITYSSFWQILRCIRKTAISADCSVSALSVHCAYVWLNSLHFWCFDVVILPIHLLFLSYASLFTVRFAGLCPIIWNHLLTTCDSALSLK